MRKVLCILFTLNIFLDYQKCFHLVCYLIQHLYFSNKCPSTGKNTFYILISNYYPSFKLFFFYFNLVHVTPEFFKDSTWLFVKITMLDEVKYLDFQLIGKICLGKIICF